MKTRPAILTAAIALAAATWFVSCKEDEAGKALVSVRMHDQAIDYDSVLVEVVGVRIHVEGEGWIDLDAQQGIYDLLQLQDGVDTLLVAPEEIPAGNLSQIRFILGDENTVVVNGVSHDLALSSQDESGLKINVHEEITEGDEITISVDFDASQSILLNGNGTYRLKPVLTATITG